MTKAALIKEAVAAGRHWVTLIDQQGAAEQGAAQQPGQRLLHRLEMHIPSGVVVEAAGLLTDEGPRYRIRSYFINRETGEKLACGSRVWNEQAFESAAALAVGLETARKSVADQFAGLTKRWERDRAAAKSSRSS